MAANEGDVKSSGQEGDLQKNIEEMRFNSIPCGVDEKGCEIFFHVKTGKFVTVTKQLQNVTKQLQNMGTQERVKHGFKSISILVSSPQEAIERAKQLFSTDNELQWVIARGDCTCGGVLMEGTKGELVLHRSGKGAFCYEKTVEEIEDEISTFEG